MRATGKEDGAALEAEASRCPACGAPEQTEYDNGGDGDTIAVRGLLTPGAAARVSWDAELLAYRCANCGGEFYFVVLSVVRNPAVSEEWRDCFFWRNRAGEATGPVERHIEKDPAGYIHETEIIPTKEGLLRRHILGPFPAAQEITGENGVSRCMGGEDWQDAARLAAGIIEGFAVTN